MKIARFGKFLMAYQPGTCDERVLRHDLIDDVYIKHLPEYRLQPTDTVIDVGAHIGAFAVRMAGDLLRGRVYALEPAAETFKYLEKNIALQKAKNIIAKKVALAGQSGPAKLYHDQESWGHTITTDLKGRSEDIPAVSLKDFLAENKITVCNFMKLNCEGAEFEIILNTPPAVLRQVKLVLILCHLDLGQGYRREDIWHYLEKAGYQLTLRNHDPRRGWIIAQLPK